MCSLTFAKQLHLKSQTSEIDFGYMFSLSQCTPNVSQSTCNQYKIINELFYFFPVLSLQKLVCILY